MNEKLLIALSKDELASLEPVNKSKPSDTLWYVRKIDREPKNFWDTFVAGRVPCTIARKGKWIAVYAPDESKAKQRAQAWWRKQK